MTHANRGRLAVDLGGNWRIYTNTLPAGATSIGTVTRNGFETGALVRIESTGLYVQVNAGAVRAPAFDDLPANLQRHSLEPHPLPEAAAGLQRALGHVADRPVDRHPLAEPLGVHDEIPDGIDRGIDDDRLPDDVSHRPPPRPGRAGPRR